LSQRINIFEARRSVADLGSNIRVKISGVNLDAGGEIIPGSDVTITLLEGGSEIGHIMLSRAEDFELDGYGVWQVYGASALSGWGPFLYDLGMEVCGTIMSDRTMVSGEAFNIWQHYQDKRGDITRVQIPAGSINIPGLKGSFNTFQLRDTGFLGRWPLAAAFHRADGGTPIINQLESSSRVIWDTKN